MANEIEVGAILEGKVTGITKFGAFVSLPGGKSGLVHISEIAYSYVSDVSDHLSEGQDVKVKVISIDENNRINLSIKRALPAAAASGPRVTGAASGARDLVPRATGTAAASPAVLPTRRLPRSPRPLTTCSNSSCPIRTASSPAAFPTSPPAAATTAAGADTSKVQRRANKIARRLLRSKKDAPSIRQRAHKGAAASVFAPKGRMEWANPGPGAFRP